MKKIKSEENFFYNRSRRCNLTTASTAAFARSIRASACNRVIPGPVIPSPTGLPKSTAKSDIFREAC